MVEKLKKSSTNVIILSLSFPFSADFRSVIEFLKENLDN